MKILWLKDKKTGHLNKAKGLLRAIAETQKIEIVEHELQWRWSGIRTLLALLGSIGFKLPLKWLFKNPPQCNGVSLILSAGGATMWPNAAIAYKHNIPNVFLGSTRQMNPSFFSMVALHDPQTDTPPFFRYEIMPSLITPDLANKDASASGIVDNNAWGLLVGGDGEDIFWKESDYRHLAETFIAQAKSANVRIRFATSRRTPKQVESMLRTLAIESGILSSACWCHEPDKSSHSLRAFMGACTRICVTADSMSMTHEAISSGRPVIVILPESGGNSRLINALTLLENSHRIVIQRLSTISIAEAKHADAWNIINHDPAHDLAVAVIHLWNSKACNSSHHTNIIP